MKKLLLLALVCVLAPLGLRAQTTVSGNLKDVGVANASGSNTYVRFTLIDYGAQIPYVSNPAANVIFNPIKDFKPDASGNISGLIQGNDTISPFGTHYQVCIYYQGAQFRCNVYRIAGSTFNLTTAIPVVIPTNFNQTILYARTMTFTQPTPLASWIIPHGFQNSQVYVFCTDLTGTQIFPDKIIWTDSNDVTVNWFAPTAGNCLVMNASNVALTSPIGNAIVSNPLGPQSIPSSLPFTIGGPLIANPFVSSSTNPAAAGALRLSASDTINWRNGANSGDVSLGKDSSDNLLASNGFRAAFFATQTANPASTFQFRLASTDGISWRNNANTADVSLSKNGSDQLVWAGQLSVGQQILANAFISSTTNASALGVIRLANGDTISSRNASNNGDVVLLTNDSQGYVDVGPNNGFVLLGGSVQATGFGGTPTISPFNGVLFGNGTSFTVAANGGVGIGGHTGGSVNLVPGSGNNGGASGVISLGSGTTVALLPSAAANPGAVMYVTDSTSIAAEGQTCTGSSSNKALAFSNGSVWKCF